MSYEPTYTKPYADGWKDSPSTETPVMAENLNAIDSAIIKIEAFLKDLDLSGLGSEYALLSEAGYSFDVSMDDYYVLTISLKNKAGDVLSSKSVDLPIESMIIDIDYADGVLTLTLQNGNTVNVSIIDIVSGLVPETRTIAGIDLKDDITAEELKTALDIYDSTVMGGELKPWLYDTSGEEVLVGVYGGKPLYRKSIELNMAIITHWVWHNTEISCDEMETVVNGFAIDENGQYYPAYIEKTRIINKISFAFGATIDDRVMKMLVIEYTKTTDAEGSGNSLTPYGIFNAKLDGIEEDIDAILADLEIKLITTTYTDIKSEGKYYLGLDCTDKPSSNACFVLALEHPTISGYLGLFALDVITNTLYTNTYQSNSGWSGWDDKASLSYVRLINGTNSGIGTNVVDWFENNAPEGISVKKISNPINAYITTESWFTFYKISKYGRIEQRPINSDKLFVKPYSNGNWLEWDEYVKKSEVAALMVVSSIDVTPDSLIESITFRRRGNVGQIVFGKLISEVEIGATVNIGTIPEGYIPMASQMGVIPVTVGTSHCSMYVGVNSSGTLSVRFMQDIPVNTQLYGLFTYMI